MRLVAVVLMAVFLFSAQALAGTGDTWGKQDLKQLTPQRLPPQEGILWHGKIYCGNVYHGQGDGNQFSDQELIDRINTCNAQGGAITPLLAGHRFRHAESRP